MSKIKLILGVIEDIRSLSVSLQALADAIMANEEQKETLHSEKLEKKVITLEEVRAVLADKSRNGHTAAVKALLQKHGADKLSEVPETEYAALLADAEVLG